MEIFIILMVIVNIYILRIMFYSGKLNDILSISIIFYSFMWLIVPGLTSLLINDFFIDNNSVETIGFLKLYLGENLVFLISLVIFLLLNKPKFHKQVFYENERIYYLFSIVYFIWILYNLRNQISDYNLNNDLSYVENSVFTGTLNLVFSFFGGYATIMAIKSRNKRVVIISIILIILNVYSIVITGARISLSWILFISLFYSFKSIYIEKVLTVRLNLLPFLTTIGIIIFFSIISVVIGKIRSDSEIEGSSMQFSGIDEFEISETFFSKFNSFSTGNLLLTGYGEATAGFKPYIGSLFFFVPRFIYPDKPMSGSIDNTYFGTPARLVPLLQNENDTVNNVGVSSLAISVWHWGWSLGILLLSIFSIINFYLLNYLFNNKNLLMNLLGCSIVPIPGFVNVFSSPDLVLKHLTLSIFLLILVKIFTYILDKTK
jgi:hypothetical protein